MRLDSRNDGETLRAVVDFIERLTTEEGPDYVPPVDRIAV